MPTSPAFSTEVAKVLNEVAKIADARARLATAERARQKLADWPASHYGYRNAEVRDALSVLDEVIAQLRVAVGITRFDLSLSANAPLAEPPPPPLPPPSDAELVEQFAAAASIADSPAERISLLQTVLRLIDRAVGLHAGGVGDAHAPHGRRRSRPRARTEQAYDELRTRTLEEAARLASRGQASDLERLRDKVKAEDKRLGGQRAGDVAALLATIDLQAASAVTASRQAQGVWDRRAPRVPPLSPLDQRRVQGVQRCGTGARAGRGDERSAGDHASAAEQTAERRQPQLQKVNAARRAGRGARADRQRVGAGRERLSPARRGGCRPTASTSRSAPRPRPPAR